MSTATSIPDPRGVEDDADVFFDGIDDTGSICINHKVDLGIEQARAVAQQILELVNSRTPASPAMTAIIQAQAEARGITWAELAVVADVDADNLTVTGLSSMAVTLCYWEQRLAEHLLRVMEA